MADSPFTTILFQLNEDGMKIQTGLTSIKGVGEKTAGLFARLHITNVGELLEHYPRDYEKMEAPVSVSALTPGRVCAVKAAVIGTPQITRVRSLVIANVQAGDATGLFRITFFGMPYIRSILDRCQAQGIHTLTAWQAAHRGGGAKRVDRDTPSGSDFLADAATRPRRHKRKE